MESFRGVPLLFLLMLFLFQTCSISAQKSTYIVHMDKSHMPLAFSTHDQWYSSIVNSVVVSDSSQARLLYTYDNVVHGFSVVLSEDELEALKKSPGYVSAYKDKSTALDTTHTFEFLSLNPTTGLWPASQFGKDVIIGMIDTGIWPESPSFRDEGLTEIPERWKGTCQTGPDFNSSLCNKKLIGARYFYKGAGAGNSSNLNGSPRDDAGHGTHTSSTAAGNYVEDVSYFGYANGTARGMAPLARLAMYKVGDSGGSFASDVLAGIDTAVADGVDVISISLGFNGAPLYEDPVAVAAFGAMEKGVLLSSSAGNDGPDLGTLHNGIPWALTTAAGSIDRLLAGTVSLGNGEEILGWTTYHDGAIIENLPLIYNQTISSCNSTELLSKYAYGIIICDNVGSFFSQMSYISEAQAKAGIFISDDPGIFEDFGFEYPGVVISPKDAPALLNYSRNGGKPSASIKFQQTYTGIQPAPVVSSYTSRGPAPSSPGILKPDIMSPGTLVLASWIPSSGESGNAYNMISGTSMACPHSSGIAALLKGAHPEWSPAAIRSAMVTTANPLDNSNAPIKDSGLQYAGANPLAMGAGQVDPNRALNPGLIYDVGRQDYINLLCSMNFTINQILTITKSNYTCETPSSDLNYPSFILLYSTNGSARGEQVNQEFVRTVTYVGDGPATFNISELVMWGNSEMYVSPSSLSFKNKYEKKNYTLGVSYTLNVTGEVGYGSLAWQDGSGRYTVRSPIVVAPLVEVW
ncbi:PREDICTED: subtilisin-like protease SBT1.7 [Ipomoea nil]|uniref:subtilisin-like protease SBT1.7 n=1 Tax=Ipomoea nil TaxID=35883 RepID=UPI000901E335|nr:PREDICTED: subtilisin-like protease SBT1.7 [Ipomoea nil]